MHATTNWRYATRITRCFSQRTGVREKLDRESSFRHGRHGQKIPRAVQPYPSGLFLTSICVLSLFTNVDKFLQILDYRKKK